LIEKNGALDFTCIFRANIYSETHLNEYKKMEKCENINKDILIENINNAMPDNILLETFLDLKLNNWVDASLFSKLCRTMYENFINSDNLKIFPYENKNIESYEIYGSIFNINIFFLNGSIAGSGADPNRKKWASSEVNRLFNNDKQEEQYYSDIFHQQSKIQKKILDIFQKDEFAKKHL